MDVIKNVTGSNIYIPDSNGDPIVNLAVEGNTTQASTPTPDTPVPVNVVSGGQEIDVVGKNLWGNVNYSITNWGLDFTYNEDGTITANGTSTNTATSISVASAITNNVYVKLEAGTYTASCENLVEGVSLQIYDTNSNSKNSTFTLNETTNIILRLRVVSGITLNNSIFKLMLEKGNQATTYEVYNGNTYEINLGKNLFNLNDIYYRRTTSISVSISNNDISIQNNQTGSTTGFVWWNIPIDIGKQITISYGDMVETTTNVNNRVEYIFSDTPITAYASATIGAGTPVSKTNKKATATATNKYLVLILRARYGGADYSYTISDIQVEYGDTQTSYSSYKTPIELCKINDYQDFIRKGTGKNLFDKDNANVENYYINNSGVLTQTTGAYSIWIECEPNTTYTVSKKASSRFRIGTGTSYQLGTTMTNIETDLTGTHLTITSGANDRYLVVWYYYASSDTQITGIRDTIMIELGNQATLFEPFGYKDKWYIYKAIGKVVLNGSESGWLSNSAGTLYGIEVSDMYYVSSNSTTPQILSNRFTKGKLTDVVNNSNLIASYHSTFYFNPQSMTLENYKTWVSTHNILAYYPLATPTTTEITDTELISQLEGIELLQGLNNVSVSSGDLPAILSIDYYTWYRYISPDDRQALIDNIATIPFKINVIQNNQIIKTLDEHSIISADYEDFRYVDTSTLVIGQFVARKFTGKLDNIYTDFEIEDTELNVQMGVSYNNNTNYYDLGNFLVTKPKKDNVKDKTSFESMDYTKKFNKVFDNTTLTYPCTALDLAKECCRQAGVELATLDFTNYNFQIPNNQYVENETCRKVMQDLGKLAYSWVRIDWDNRCYLDFNVKNNIVDSDKLTNSNYYSLNLQKKVFGPVNRVVIGMQDVEGENAVIEDAESIAQYGVTELQIYDNNITYTPELRLQAIQAATKLFGIAYTPVEMNTTGHPWLLGNEKVQITTMDDETIYTYPWDRSIAYSGHIKTKITSKADTKTETEYKNYGGLEDALRKTRIIVDKEQGEITALTTQTQTIRDDLRDNYYDQTQTNILIQTASTGLTNTFSEAGGNNIFRNTGLWFSATTIEQTLLPSTSLYPSEELFMSAKIAYEFWDGIVKRVKEEKASNMNALLLQNSYVAQEQIVPNGKYTISFKYNKPIALSVAKVFINDVEYVLSEVNDTEFVEVIEVSSQHINIKFYCDIDNGCEIYDLMANAGEVKLAYSQNQNETTTDTVNISKGITITSSDLDVKFKADADGIRTLDNNSNEITKFTDTGMKTKEAIIESKSQIVGTLWQEVGNQTWITRL